MINYGSSSSGTQRIRVTEMLKLRTAFDGRQFKRVLIVIKEF